jgi:hypothetical protein
MKSTVFLALVLTIGSVGCEDYGDSVAYNRLPLFISFNYTAYDTLGAVSATGTLNLSTDDSHVSGFWKFDDGRAGNLAGSIVSDKIQIDLYPGYADHNLILTGRFSGTTFSGEWIMYGWAILGRGSFIAKVK